MNKPPLIRRFRLKEGSDPDAEVTEEFGGQIEEFLKKAKVNNEFYNNLGKMNFGTKVYNIDADISLDSTKKAINNIFYKRVFIVADYLPLEKKEDRES